MCAVIFFPAASNRTPTQQVQTMSSEEVISGDRSSGTLPSEAVEANTEVGDYRLCAAIAVRS